MLKYVSLISRQTVDFQRCDYITARNKEVLHLRYPLFGSLSFSANSKTRIKIGEQICNSYRGLFPNIDTAYFCNIGMEKPYKHWIYAASVGGDGGIRTLVPQGAS